MGELQGPLDIDDGPTMGDQLLRCLEIPDDLLGSSVLLFIVEFPAQYDHKVSYSPWFNLQSSRVKPIPINP